jgi:hypothetical protein
MGEGSIRLLKKHINGTNGNWAYNAALLYLKEKSITNVVLDLTESLMKNQSTTEIAAPVQSMLRVTQKKLRFENKTENHGVDDISLDGDKDETEEQTTFTRNSAITMVNSKYKDVHIYCTVEEAVAEFTSGRPVSLVMLVDSTFWILIKEDQAIQVIHVEPRKSTSCGAEYFRWEVADGVVRSIKGSFMQFSVPEYCLLLPKLELKGLPSANTFDQIFYLITSSWKEMLLDSDQDAIRLTTGQIWTVLMPTQRF